MPLTPNPRYRLYSSFRSYSWLVRDAMLGRFFQGMEDVEELERRLQSRFGVRHAVCMPMARMGIYLALKHSIRPGQKVIMPPYTIADVVNMVISAGGIPVFADIQRETCNIDPAQVGALLTGDTGAVMVTHLHGLAAPVSDIKRMCERRGVLVLEDAAQAFGALEGKGQPIGAVGDVGVVSVGTYKNVNCWYGGAILTDREDIAKKARAELSSWPFMSIRFLRKRMFKTLATDLATWPPIFRLFTYWIFRYGHLRGVRMINRFVETELDLSRRDSIPAHYQARLTPAQARLALSQLDEVDRLSDIRIANAALYHQGLSGIVGLMLPPLRTDRSHIYTSFPVQTEDRKGLLRWMMRCRRDVGAQHLKNCADLPGFSPFYRDCPNARQTAEQVVLLPTYPSYGQRQVLATIAAVGEFFGRRTV